MIGTKFKQPADQLDYDVDFTGSFPDDDPITSVTAVCEDEDLIIVSTVISSPFVKVWLAGGVSGMTYKVTVTASTENGRIKEEDFKIRVRDC